MNGVISERNLLNASQNNVCFVKKNNRKILFSLTISVIIHTYVYRVFHEWFKISGMDFSCLEKRKKLINVGPEMISF